MLTVDTDTSTTPLDNIRSVKYNGHSAWLQSAPASFGKADFSYPSAICYYFARELYTHFNSTVPIGIISASVGGSAIEFWQSPAARADKTCGGGINITSACPPNTLATEVPEAPEAPTPALALAPAAAAAAEASSSVAAKAGGWTPSCFYNAMVHPLGNFIMKGILWDQGEANNGDDCSVWGCKLAALAYDYRTTLFKQPDLLFTFDQFRADPFAGGIGVPGYAKLIPKAAFSSRVDLQTCLASDTSEGHAIRKLEVGRRLGMAARVSGYGEAPVVGSYGPMITAVSAAPAAAAAATAASAVGDGSLVEVTVTLANAGGLHHADLPDCDGCCAGAGGPLIQGSPKTGDAWIFGLTSGGTATVCQNTTHPSCTGQIAIHASSSPSGNSSSSGGGVVTGAADGATVTMLVVLPAGKSIEYVLYGGTGPWLSSSEEADVLVADSKRGVGSSSSVNPTSEQQQQQASKPATCNLTRLWEKVDCHVNMTNLTSPAITSADQCVAACCAATKFTCNMAQWCEAGQGCPAPGCYGGNEPSCTRSAGWVTFQSPAPEKCVYPHQPRFGLEACGLYNGVGGYDDHAGVAMPAQYFRAVQ